MAYIYQHAYTEFIIVCVGSALGIESLIKVLCTNWFRSFNVDLFRTHIHITMLNKFFPIPTTWHALSHSFAWPIKKTINLKVFFAGS